MNLSLKWLADYVDCGVSAKDFCAGMTMSGSKVETYETEVRKSRMSSSASCCPSHPMKTPTTCRCVR